MKDNGLLKYYENLVSKQGLINLDGLSMPEEVEDCGYGKKIRVLQGENGNRYYVKRCSELQQSAEVLLSQVYARAGFDTAIYLPAENNLVISNDVGAKGEIAEKFFLRKVAAERAIRDPRGARSMLESKVIDPYALGLSYVDRYIKFMTPECAKKYFEMRGFDIAAKNTDRHLSGYFLESDEDDLGYKLNLIDYGYSAINHIGQRFSEPRYCSMIGGKINCERNLLLWQLSHDDDVAQYVNPQQLAEKMRSVDVVAAADDIKQTIGFEVNPDFVEDIAYSFRNTAFDLTHT